MQLVPAWFSELKLRLDLTPRSCSGMREAKRASRELHKVLSNPVIPTVMPVCEIGRAHV